MKEIFFITLFLICWATFLKIFLYIYNSICYICIDKIIKEGSDKQNEKLGRMF